MNQLFFNKKNLFFLIGDESKAIFLALRHFGCLYV